MLPANLSEEEIMKLQSPTPIAPPEGVLFRDPRLGVGLEDKILKRVGSQILVLPKEQFTGNFESLPAIAVAGEFENLMQKQGGGFRQVTADQFTQGIAPAPVLPKTPPLATAPSPVGGAPVDLLAGVTAPMGSLERSQQLFQAIELAKQRQEVLTGKTPTGIAAAAPVASAPPVIPSAPIKDVSSLLANQTIKNLETKITDLSEKISAGIASGGATEILTGLFEKFGVTEETKLLNTYNAQILETQQRLRKIPDDIKTTLQDVGVTDAQLNRLILKETQKPMEILRDLMEQKGAAQDRINQTLKFVGIFSDAAMQDKAAKIEAIKFDFETNKDLLSRLDKKQQDFVKLILDDKKETLSLVEDITKGGATEAERQDALNLSKEQILTRYGNYLVKPEKVTGQSDFEQAFLRDKGRLPTVEELLDFKKLSAEAGREREIEGGKIFTETTMSPDLRSDIIDTLSDKEGLKKLGRKLELRDLTKLFPNVETATLQSLMDKFSVDVEFEETKGTKKWWQFWK